MHVTTEVWLITIAVMTVVLAVDIFVIGRRPHEPSMKEAGIAIGVFSGLAILFGLGVWYVSGPRFAAEFFAGWLTEYSLSIDNLFIFVIIMANLRVPRKLQQFALMVGIVLALIFRGIFIALGAAAIGLLLAAARDCARMDRDIRAGVWAAREGIELHGKTLGVVGTGPIGAQMVRIAAGFGMRVVAWNRSGVDPALPCEELELDRLLAGADVLTEYAFNTGVARHLFCRRCGVKSFYVPRSNPDGFSVNARCLETGTIATLAVEPFDGRNWENSAGVLRHLSSG